jgi:[ribosomal protein S5]-alanine N-acetyltransferase
MNSYRTYLRAFELADYQTTLLWHNDDEIWFTVGGPKYFVSSEIEKKWIEETIFSYDPLKLAVCLHENDSLIGMVSLSDFNWINRSAECACMIGEKSAWGHGYAVEARLQLLKFGFLERSLHRVSSQILEGNLAGRRMVQKCGFKEEGLLREAVFKNGRFQNVVIYSILQDEFSLFMEEYEQ